MIRKPTHVYVCKDGTLYRTTGLQAYALPTYYTVGIEQMDKHGYYTGHIARATGATSQAALAVAQVLVKALGEDYDLHHPV
jgi:hypothetical protein